ncbi:TPA: hypothetical protein OZI11_002480 [Staphylococcus aureus]|nr:hypothetical protein [Staphylococcus aureus]
MLYLRGKKNRKIFHDEYDYKPIAHLRLLKGQQKHSVGGQELKHSYYCFMYNKKGSKKTDTFVCGYHIANELLKLSNQERLPLFNPLKSVSQSDNGQTQILNDEHREENGNDRWNPLAKQISELIGLLDYLREDGIKGALANIKIKVDENHDKNTEFYHRYVKGLNTAFGRFRPDRTFEDIKQEVIRKHDLDKNDLRDFKCNIINDELNKLNIESNFE